jgi:hypothetical protein
VLTGLLQATAVARETGLRQIVAFLREHAEESQAFLVSVLRAAELPVRHQVLRAGSPCTLAAFVQPRLCRRVVAHVNGNRVPPALPGCRP